MRHAGVRQGGQGGATTDPSLGKVARPYEGVAHKGGQVCPSQGFTEQLESVMDILLSLLFVISFFDVCLGGQAVGSLPDY